MYKQVIFILTLSSLDLHETAKILAWFPVPSISHQLVFRTITHELTKRGHELTVVTPNPTFPKDQIPENLTQIDVHDISYEAWKTFFMMKQHEMTNDLVQQMEIFLEAFIEVIDVQLDTKEMKEIINATQKFDLLLIEACAVPALAISEVFKVPVILVSSFGAIAGQLEAFGAPYNPFLYPLALRKRTYNLTILEKIQLLYTEWKLSRLEDKFNNPARAMLKKHFKMHFPSLQDAMKRIDLLLLNEHPLWTGNRPVPPNVIYMGGVHQKPQGELPQDLKLYLDSSKQGVIYISFGTNVDPLMLEPSIIKLFTNVLSKLPYVVLWKWNQDELPGRTRNIKISKWLPQSDLLHHPNIKLFITQGGLQSTDEAITAGVPVIGVPFIADQWYNVEQCVHHGVGLQLDIKTLNEEKLKESIETIIGDPSYRRNMMNLRELMQDQPMSPLERAVWWTEHILRHGGARHLRATAANIVWTEYYQLELASIILGVLIMSVLVIVIAVKYVLCLVKRIFVNENKVKLS